MDSEALTTMQGPHQEHTVGGNEIINSKCFQSPLVFSCFPLPLISPSLLENTNFLFQLEKWFLAHWVSVGACYFFFFVHLACCDNFMSCTWKQVVMSQVHSKLPSSLSLPLFLPSFSFFSCPSLFLLPYESNLTAVYSVGKTVTMATHCEIPTI